ncbi:MAG: transposase [Proteobacteria bacterium]|nr:transposase [Pseudomonadota bacterium]
MTKRYSAKLKFQVVIELLTGEKTLGQVAKVYGVHSNTVSAWKKAFFEKGPEIFSQANSMAEYERRIAELERLIGRKEVEIALLKNFLGRPK